MYDSLPFQKSSRIEHDFTVLEGVELELGPMSAERKKLLFDKSGSITNIGRIILVQTAAI
jgi:hypothetical protein